MSDEELKAYAEYLILDHAFDIEWLSYFECYEVGFPDASSDEISDEDARKVRKLINDATITITFN